MSTERQTGQALVDAIWAKAAEREKQGAAVQETVTAPAATVPAAQVVTAPNAVEQPQKAEPLRGQALVDAIWAEAERKGNVPQSTVQARPNASIVQMPLAKMEQAKHQQAGVEIQAKNDAFRGTSDETRRYDAYLEAAKEDDESFEELSRFYTMYQANPGAYSGEEFAKSAQEKLAAYEALTKKWGVSGYGEFQQMMKNLESDRNAIAVDNLMKADIATLESWPEEDRAQMDTVVAHSASGLTDLVGLKARFALDEKYGKETVTRILESAQRNRNAQKAQDAAKAGETAGDNLLNTAFSIPAGWLGSAMAAPGQILGGFTGTGRYPSADPYTAGTELGIWAENVQSATAENAKQHAMYTMEANGFSKEAQEAAGDFAAGVYQVGVGVAENLLRAATFGGTGSLAMAALGSFSSTYRQAAENGASAGQALAMGVVAGFLETATEKIPLDNLLDGIAKAGSQSWGSILKEALVQGGIEATTEEINYLGNVLAQAAILRESSDYNAMIRSAMANGVSYDEAVKLADQQIIMQAGQTAAMAFFQGAGSSAVGSASGKLMPGNLLQQQAQSHSGYKKTEASQSTNAKSHGVTPAAESVKASTNSIFDNKPVVNTENGTQAAQGGHITVDELMEGIGDKPKTMPTQSQQAARSQGVNISDLLDETIAERTGAPADPVGAAMESYQQTGTVTNKQATDILNSARAVTQLMEQADLKIYGLTKSQQRQAVKEAVQALSAQLTVSDNPSVSEADREPLETVDTASQTGYNNTRSEQVSHIIDRLNGNGENVPTIDEIMAIPEIAEAERANDGTETINLPNREQIRENGYQKAMQKGSWNGTDYSGEVRQDKRMDIVIGLPGSGKSSVYTKRLSQEHKSRVIDTDDFREYIPEYNGSNAALVHEEASGIRDKVLNAALDSGDNILLSTIGANAQKLARQIAQFKEEGYEVYLHLNELPNNKSLARAIGRYISEDGSLGRYVSPKLIAEYGDKPTQTYLYLTRQGGNINGRLESNLRQSGGQSYEDVGRTGGTAESQAIPGDLLAGYDWYSNDVEEGEDQKLIQSSDKLEHGRQQTPAADESVGAAPSGFDPISHLQYEYGTLPPGENAVRDDSLPKSTDGENRVSQTAVTVKGAEATPDEFADLIDKEVTKGGLSYIPIKNSDTVQSCVETVKKQGWEQAKADWHAAVHAGKTGADMSAMGALLLNNAANAGDKTAWLDILHDYQLLGTNTAQGLQALRILKTLSPDDKLYMIRRSVKQMVDDMQLDTEIELDEDLLHEFEEAETDEARDEVLDKIQQSVADQIPSTFMDKFTALRYVNMLGNLRTQVRNIAGNLGMKGISAVRNAIATGIETVAHKLSGGKIEKTKSLTVSKEQLESGKADFDQFKSIILGGGKYADSRQSSTEFAQGVQDKRTIFKSKAMEGYRKATNWAMEQGDLIFSKAAYARALAGYLKAHGITETDYTKIDTELLNDARLYAVQEAQEQTFRDTNWLSRWVSKIGRRKDTPAAAKAFIEGVMPFRKTPANVLVRAEEYSPLGVINSVYYSVKAAQKGSDVTASQVINSWAKTLTGSGIFALGMLLSNLGVLAGGPDEDEDKEEFEELSGYQNYALQIGDASYTIDWLTPAAMPLLMGAELWELIQNGGFEAKDLEQALLSIADPMIQMSMLQGINDTLENVRYADSNLGQLAANSALSYLTQGLTNTALGQIERSFEDSRMTTYVDKESAVPAWLQRTIGKASAKIPGWDYNQVPYINAWGEEEENPQWAAGLAYNMLSPGYIEKGVSDDVYQELVRLNEAQGDVTVFPASPDKTITIDKQERNLSAEQWVSLAKMQGQTARGIVEDIISSKYYEGLSDAQKAKAISYAYDYAREHARVETLEDYNAYSAKWMNDIAGKEAEAILRKVAAGGVDSFSGLPIDKAAMLSEAIAELFDKPMETKPDGTSYTSVRTIQKVETVAQSSLTEKEQQEAMGDILDDKAYEKYLKILEAGYDTDDYAESYRIYLDAEGTKAEKIRELQEEMDLSYAAAKTLYEIYSPPK